MKRESTRFAQVNSVKQSYEIPLPHQVRGPTMTTLLNYYYSNHEKLQFAFYNLYFAMKLSFNR